MSMFLISGHVEQFEPKVRTGELRMAGHAQSQIPQYCKSYVDARPEKLCTQAHTTVIHIQRVRTRSVTKCHVRCYGTRDSRHEDMTPVIFCTYVNMRCVVHVPHVLHQIISYNDTKCI